MAVLSRVNLLSQQRWDLHHGRGSESFLANDFRQYSKILNGINSNFVVRGFEAISANGLSITFSVKDSVALLALDNVTSFYVGLSDDSNITITVPSSTNSVFIEAYFERVTGAPVTGAFWDPGAVTTATPLGAEFTASADFEEFVSVQIRVTTSGFTPGSLPLAVVSTGTNTINTIRDSREMFFRLGGGGVSPNPFRSFDWANSRAENDVIGNPASLGQNLSTNPYFSVDASGYRNDKGIDSLKSWMDAVMTVLKEIKGTTLWYSSGGSNSSINAPALIHTENGYNLNGDLSTRVQWSQNSDNVLRVKGTGPLTWNAAFGLVQFELGQTFTSPSLRTYSDSLFVSSVVPDGRNLYLRMERETTPSAATPTVVSFGTQFDISEPANRSISGSPGDFTGIAVGDYIRKGSAGYFQYHVVDGLWNGASLATTDGTVATASITGIRVSADYLIDAASIEEYRWMRKRYQLTDTFISEVNGLQATNTEPSTVDVDDINMIWLGRRRSTVFTLRHYGLMQPGEESYTNEDSDAGLSNQAGPAEIFLKHDMGLQITSGGAYSTITVAPAYLLEIQKRKTINMINHGVGNINAWQTFRLNPVIPVAFANDGDGLWVRLDDEATATPVTLTSGTIASGTNNVYEVLPASSNPLRDFTNKNVHLLARRINYGGGTCLQFADGSLCSEDGWFLPTDMSRTVNTTTDTITTTLVPHGFRRATRDYTWTAYRTALDERTVYCGAVQQDDGLLLDPTANVENLTITFVRRSGG